MEDRKSYFYLDGGDEGEGMMSGDVFRMIKAANAVFVRISL